MDHPNPSRLIGLGANPSDAVAASVLQCGFTQVPVAEYVTWTVELPQLDASLTSTFGDEIDILQSPKSVIGVTSVDSSFVLNGVLQTDMLAVGFGCHLYAEPLAFTQIGNAVAPLPASGTPTINSPDVWTANDLAAGNIDGTPSSTASINPAVIEWGNDAWQAAWHLANAYQFQWIMQQRYQVIKEMVSDVSYFAPYAEAVAAGTSQVAIIDYVRTLNDRYRSIGGGGIFVPVNSRRVGSFTGSPTASVNNGTFHPTRDFDLAPVTWGGLRVQGGAGCCQPFRKLIRPVLVEKGIPVGMSLFVQDAYHQAQMLKFLSISESLGGNLAVVTIDANDTGTSIVDAQAMPELTLDATPVQVAQSVKTSRTKFKGGSFQLSILIKGFEVWGPWKEFLLTQMSAYIQSPTAAIPGMAGLPAYRR